MAKSFVPRMLVLARALLFYMTRHQATVFTFVTDAAMQSAYTDCVSCLSHLLSLWNRPAEAP